MVVVVEDGGLAGCLIGGGRAECWTLGKEGGRVNKEWGVQDAVVVVGEG